MFPLTPNSLASSPHHSLPRSKAPPVAHHNTWRQYQLGERHGRGDVLGQNRPSANRNSELECRGPGTRSKTPARYPKTAARTSRGGPVSKKRSFRLFFFRFDWPLAGPGPRAVRSHAAVCVLRLHLLKLLNVRQASSFLAFLWSLGHLSFTLCERSSQWTEQTDRLNYVLVRSQGRGLYRALETWASCPRGA